ncbi:hypothetical protein ACFV6K_32475, partial [Streptomyces sp. NPDC059814]
GRGTPRPAPRPPPGARLRARPAARPPPDSAPDPLAPDGHADPVDGVITITEAPYDTALWTDSDDEGLGVRGRHAP